MNKQVAIALDAFAKVVAERYSNISREGNINAEIFEVSEIIPTSDQTAVVMYIKTGGKYALAFFYYIGKGSNPCWNYFFPTDSHVAGFDSFKFYKFEVERKNYDKNFPE